MLVFARYLLNSRLRGNDGLLRCPQMYFIGYFRAIAQWIQVQAAPIYIAVVLPVFVTVHAADYPGPLFDAHLHYNDEAASGAHRYWRRVSCTGGRAA